MDRKPDRKPPRPYLQACIVGAVLIAAAHAAAATETARRSGAPQTLAVLDIEILGDLGDPSLAPIHDARRRTASTRLREELDRSGRYRVADNAAARDMIERLGAVQYLHKCNGCELDIARALGAQQVLVAWVNRISALVLTLNYEIRVVESGAAVARGAFDFRGDNDEAWRRAVLYLAKDLNGRAEGLTPPK